MKRHRKLKPGTVVHHTVRGWYGVVVAEDMRYLQVPVIFVGRDRVTFCYPKNLEVID